MIEIPSALLMEIMVLKMMLVVLVIWINDYGINNNNTYDICKNLAKGNKYDNYSGNEYY